MRARALHTSATCMAVCVSSRVREHIFKFGTILVTQSAIHIGLSKRAPLLPPAAAAAAPATAVAAAATAVAAAAAAVAAAAAAAAVVTY